MLRAVPAMISAAWSTSRAFRSSSFVSAIWRTWSRERRPTFVRFGSAEPLSIRSASLMRTAAGGVFVMNEKERSSKTVISTGVIRPFWSAVCALNALQNSMMFTPCWPSAGPTGGAGFAWPPGICSLMSVRTFFAIPIPLVELLHVVESDLDRHLPLEDVHHHLELLRVRVHVGDLAVEVRKRAGGDLHGLAELVLDLRSRRRGCPVPRVEDPVDLGLRQRHGLRACADESGHARRVLHDRPGVVVQVHVHEHVAREHALLGLDLLPVLRLDHLLGGDDDAAEPLALAHRLDPVLEIGLHLVLVPGIRVDDIPLKHGFSDPRYRRSTCLTTY